MSVSQLLIKLYNLVAGHNDITSFQLQLKTHNLIQQLTIIIEHIQNKKIKQDYKNQKKQLQIYESEVQSQYQRILFNELYDMKNQIKQFEQQKDEFKKKYKNNFECIIYSIISFQKLKKENEELYTKFKILLEELNYYRQIEIYTQQSTKISNTKTIEKLNKFKEKQFHTNITPQKSANQSFDCLVNKRFSQQIVQRKYSFQKYMSNKRRSCTTDLSKSM